MSQFAAHDEAGGHAPSRTAELTPAPATHRRGTAQGFRELQQRLRGKPAAAVHTPALEPVEAVPPVPREAHASPQQLSEPVLVEPLEQVLEGPHAFDLASLFGTDEPLPMVELSGMDRPPSDDLLLEGTIPSTLLAVGDVDVEEQPTTEPSEAEPHAPQPVATTPLELKQLRLPTLREYSPRQTAKLEFEGLTEREREVAGLIATGKSNAAIAAELVISQRTVETHVTNILGKLGFASRSQIAVWATERGIANPAT